MKEWRDREEDIERLQKYQAEIADNVARELMRIRGLRKHKRIEDFRLTKANELEASFDKIERKAAAGLLS